MFIKLRFAIYLKKKYSIESFFTKILDFHKKFFKHILNIHFLIILKKKGHNWHTHNKRNIKKNDKILL